MRKSHVLFTIGLWIAGAAFAKPPAPGKRMFLPAVRVASAEEAKKIVVADFNRDGKQDFAVLHWRDGGGEIEGIPVNKGYLIRVYLNLIAKPLDPPAFVHATDLIDDDDTRRRHPMFQSDFTVADFNGDGNPDIAVANSHDDAIRTYLGLGTGTFSAVVNTPAMDDDPCYLAAGNYNGDGHLDIGVLHVIRGEPGNAFAWKFAFMFGKGDGTFEKGVIQEEGNFPFPGGLGTSPFYYSETWNIENGKSGVVLPDLTTRDVVWANDRPLYFTDSLQGELKIHPKFKNCSAGDPKTCWGSALFDSLTDPGRSNLATEAGRVLALRSKLLGDQPAGTYRSSLDPFFPDRNGRSRLESLGAGLAAADFDADDTLDLALLSSELGGPGGRLDRDHSGYTIFIAYGLSTPGSNPLDTDHKGFDVGRYKEIANDATWRYGHRPWQIAAADFDLDEFPDLLTLTSGGVLLHPNLGMRSFEFPPPRLDDLAGFGGQEGGGTAAGDPLHLFGDFPRAERHPMSMLLTPKPPAADEAAFLAITEPDSAAPRTRLNTSLPPDNIVKPGTYKIAVYDGITTSRNPIPEVKVVRRALQIADLRLHPVESGASHAELAADGWFGNASGPDPDLDKATFLLESSTGFSRPLRVIRRSAGGVVLAVGTGVAPGTYTVKTESPGRKGHEKAGLGIDFSPRIKAWAWFNRSAGTRGSTTWAPRVPIHPGAEIEVIASLLRAPSTVRWTGLASGRRVEGSGSVEIRGGISNDNKESSFLFTLPATVKAGETLELRLATDTGMFSNPITLEIKAPSGGGGGGTLKWFFFAQEHKLGPHSCRTIDVLDKDEASALAALKRSVINPDEYFFEKIEEAEFSGAGVFTACNWQWKYDIESSGTTVEKVTVTALKRETADKKAADQAQAGETAVFKEGPIKK